MPQPATKYDLFARYPLAGRLTTVVIVSHDGDRAVIRPFGDLAGRIEVDAGELLQWPGLCDPKPQGVK